MESEFFAMSGDLKSVRISMAKEEGSHVGYGGRRRGRRCGSF